MVTDILCFVALKRKTRCCQKNSVKSFTFHFVSPGPNTSVFTHQKFFFHVELVCLEWLSSENYKNKYSEKKFFKRAINASFKLAHKEYYKWLEIEKKFYLLFKFYNIIAQLFKTCIIHFLMSFIVSRRKTKIDLNSFHGPT